MPPRSNPGSIVYDHFGFTILLTDQSLKNISIYLEGQLPTDAAPPSPGAARVEQGLKEGAAVSQAVAEADAANPGKPTTIGEMLDVAAQDPTKLGGLVTAPKVGAFEKVEAGEGASLARRGSIQVSSSGTPEVVMEESLLKGNVSDHMETSYFEAIQVAFAELMKDEAAANAAKKEEERA